MDAEGELRHSRHKDTADCLFQRIGSAVATRLLQLRAAELQPPEPSWALVGSLLGPLGKRQRRSEQVNPSDPLRSQSHPSHPAKEHKDAEPRQPDQDQAGAVSKETISSCDDPLHVLHSNGPVSPVKTNIADRAEQD
ncbi:hypothetical protein EYF80_021554 [Liparis tanakae]|uniref:Uncharacterized protein n=1 Tax=Liparis tanakae TaxID=230148 RepID=A0A4Z2HTN4_9TELE|nr:hypothetical protein EYF80_021554 [Liparis tanakae]